jgi:hypothetical protein
VAATECALFYELATEKGHSHAAEVITRDRFLVLYPEFRDVPDAPVILSPLDEDLPEPPPDLDGIVP